MSVPAATPSDEFEELLMTGIVQRKMIKNPADAVLGLPGRQARQGGKKIGAGLG
jgi:hypothetical protein